MRKLPKYLIADNIIDFIDNNKKNIIDLSIDEIENELSLSHTILDEMVDDFKSLSLHYIENYYISYQRFLDYLAVEKKYNNDLYKIYDYIDKKSYKEGK